MGLSPFKRCRGLGGAQDEVPNPNPKDFRILQYSLVKTNLVVVVKYKGCSNFEGEKILVFKNMTVKQLKSMSSIDPHFHESSSLIARFVPTQEGWALAINCALMI